MKERKKNEKYDRFTCSGKGYVNSYFTSCICHIRAVHTYYVVVVHVIARKLIESMREKKINYTPLVKVITNQCEKKSEQKSQVIRFQMELDAHEFHLFV